MPSPLLVHREVFSSRASSRALRRARPLLWAAGVLIAACGGSGGGYGSSPPPPPTSSPAPAAECTLASAQATTSVSMQNISFVPSCIKVAPGTTVTFKNNDNTSHTVTTDASQAESFDSGVVTPGSSYQHTFSTAGAIGLYCKIHGAMMHATVIVDPSVPPAASSTAVGPGTAAGGSGSGGAGTGSSTGSSGMGGNGSGGY